KGEREQARDPPRELRRPPCELTDRATSEGHEPPDRNADPERVRGEVTEPPEDAAARGRSGRSGATDRLSLGARDASAIAALGAAVAAHLASLRTGVNDRAETRRDRLLWLGVTRLGVALRRNGLRNVARRVRNGRRNSRRNRLRNGGRNNRRNVGRNDGRNGLGLRHFAVCGLRLASRCGSKQYCPACPLRGDSLVCNGHRPSICAGCFGVLRSRVLRCNVLYTPRINSAQHPPTKPGQDWTGAVTPARHDPGSTTRQEADDVTPDHADHAARLLCGVFRVVAVSGVALQRTFYAAYRLGATPPNEAGAGLDRSRDTGAARSRQHDTTGGRRRDTRPCRPRGTTRRRGDPIHP